MKKNTIFITAVSAFMTLSAVASVSLTNEVVHTHAEDGKTIVEVDITTEQAMNNNVIVFNLSEAIDTSDFQSANLTWYVNNKACTTSTGLDGTRLFFTWNDNKPSTMEPSLTNYYTHYQIKAGETLYTSSTANYVLKNDYNFWSTVLTNRAPITADGAGFSYLFQHGGNDHFHYKDERTGNFIYPGLTNGNLNSLKFTSFGGGCQDNLYRFLFQPKYEETSDDWTYAGCETHRNPIYINKGEGYVLSADVDTSPMIWADGLINNQPNSESLLFLMRYSQLFGSDAAEKKFEDVSMDCSYYSFYIPDGTLWGALDFPFMIQGDYYFEIVKDASKGYWHGFFDTPHEYVKHDATDETEGKYGNIEYYTCSRNTHSNETDEYFVKNADETYTKTTLADTEIKTSHENATKWAQEFIKKTAEPCSDQNADNYNKLTADEVWPALKTSYEALDDVAKQVVKINTIGDTDIKTAMSLYKYITNKYTKIDDFIGGTTSASSSVSNIVSNKIDTNNSIMIISLIAFISVSTIGGVVLLKKKRQ